MASIIQISGTKNKTSTPNTRWSITANEACLFEVPDWIPKTTPDPAGGILAVPPAQIELGTRAKVTWQLKDKTQKILFKTIASNVLDKFNLSINKKYSGSYTYFLEAKLDGKSDVASTFVSGFCDPKITVAKWSKKEGTNDTSDVKCGNIVYVTLDTEGLNGDKLTFEFFSEKDTKKSIASVTEECINGDCVAKIPTIGAAALTKTATESFYVKVKNPLGVYIKNGSDEKVIKFKILKDVVPPVADVPTNTTVLKVGEPDKVTLESTGIISLEKIAVTTTYEVCNDEVGNFDDYKNFWILEDKKEYFHWLKKRTNKDDLAKPTVIPITLSSTDLFSFKATFKTILPINQKLQIRVKDKNGKYIFDPNDSFVKNNKDDEQVLTFTNKIKDSSGNPIKQPYDSTVQYFPNFELIFEYSIDGKSWTPLGSAMFCFYMTHGKPGYSLLSGATNPNETQGMDITNRKTNKKAILETMLYISCKYAIGAKTDDDIIKNIFKHIALKKVGRARNSSPMGYWRNTSSLHNSRMPFRNGRVLLKTGEARCGEWNRFLQDVCKIQSDTLFPSGTFYDFVIYPGISRNVYGSGINFPSDIAKRAAGTLTPDDKNACFLVKNWTINSPTPIDKGGSAQDLSNDPLNMFWDHVFLKYKNQYFDPSYGLHEATVFADDIKLLSAYTKKALSGVLYVNVNGANPLIDAIAYKPKAGEYFDPTKPYTLGQPSKQNLKYNVVTKSMEDILLPVVRPA